MIFHSKIWSDRKLSVYQYHSQPGGLDSGWVSAPKNFFFFLLMETCILFFRALQTSLSCSMDIRKWHFSIFNSYLYMHNMNLLMTSSYSYSICPKHNIYSLVLSFKANISIKGHAAYAYLFLFNWLCWERCDKWSTLWMMMMTRCDRLALLSYGPNNFLQLLILSSTIASECQTAWARSSACQSTTSDDDNIDKEKTNNS